MKKVLFASLLFLLVCYNAQLKAATPGTVKWSIFLGNEYDLPKYNLPLPSIGPDGTIYAVYYTKHRSDPTQGKLYAINPNGTIKWELSMIPTTVPAVDANGNIYVGTLYGAFYSISPDGSVNWTFDDGHESWSDPGIHKDGTIYVGGAYFRGINPDGSLKWSKDAHPPGTWGGGIGPPVFSYEGMIYGISRRHRRDDYFIVIDPEKNVTTERVKIDIGDWTVDLETEIAISDDGTIYICTEQYPDSPGSLVALNPDLSTKWIAEIAPDPEIIGSGPVIGIDGTIYVGVSGYGLTAVSPEGALKWRYAYTSGSVSIGSSGTIYTKSLYFEIATLEVKTCLLALNPNGTLKWKSDNIGGFEGPMLSDDGTIYVLSTDGYLYAFYSDSKGIGKTPWPMYRHDPQHTGQAVSMSELTKKNRSIVQNILMLLND